MIDQCLSTLIAEKYTTIQEDISQNSELDNLYSGLQNKQINNEDIDANTTLQFWKFEKRTSKSYHCIKNHIIMA